MSHPGVSALRIRPLLAAAAAAFTLTWVPAGAAESALPPGIAWYKGDVETAFAKARAGRKPLLLYWGAEWCPPCNEVKATIFTQPAFIASTREFIPVYIDGDGPKAQQLGERFKVRGYPTLILFKPDGTEITRLPGQADPDRYLGALRRGLAAALPVGAVLATALREPGSLSGDDWELLADYDWGADEAKLLPMAQSAAMLQSLANAVPPGRSAVAVRLQLAALGKAVDAGPLEFDQAASLAALEQALNDPGLGRSNIDLLGGRAAAFTRLLTQAQTPPRQRLVAAWLGFLDSLAADATRAAVDRLTALADRCDLLGLDGAAVPGEAREEVRQRVAGALAAPANPYERLVLVDAAVTALRSANLLDEADTLLKSELPRSRAPAYFMLELATDANRRGDNAAALDWRQRAYAAAVGSATRLQWGVGYLTAIIDLAPEDSARFDAAAAAVLKELTGMQDPFYGRNRRAVEKLLGKLAAWNQDGSHAASVDAVTARLRAVCRLVPHREPQRASCEALLSPPAR